MFCFDARLSDLDRRARHGVERDPLLAQVELAAIDAADVEQVVDEARQLGDLPLHHVDGLLGQRGAGLRLQQREAIAQRRERIPELVRQHREELALVRVGPLQLRGTLAQFEL
jgi:hypothetical protein